MANKALQTRSKVDNRYALTNIHIDDSVKPGTRRHGLWKVPALTSLPEIPLTEGTYARYTVTTADIARPDLIAWRHYKDVSLWWVIARYNGIMNPLEDMTVGDILLIPRKDLIVNAVEQKRTFV